VQNAQAALIAGQIAHADFVVRNALILGTEAAVQLSLREEADQLLTKLREAAEGRPNALLTHNANVSEALLASRRGRAADADELLARARALAESEGANYERTYWAWRSQVLCERGLFAEAAAAADRTIALDVELDQPFPALRARLQAFRARVGGRLRISLADGLGVPREADARGAPAVAALARLWIGLDESLRGEPDPFDEPQLPDLAEARALAWAIRGLRDLEPRHLLAAADEWSSLGDTVWLAQSLLWHEALSGEGHPEGRELLGRLGAPEGLAEVLIGQVDALRS
jgi:hypothetical protein